MNENPIVQGGTPEAVAYALMRDIALCEGKSLDGAKVATRKWLLDTYAECLATVRDPEERVAAVQEPVPTLRAPLRR